MAPLIILADAFWKAEREKAANTAQKKKVFARPLSGQYKKRKAWK